MLSFVDVKKEKAQKAATKVYDLRPYTLPLVVKSRCHV
jgi:hypothetical protein